MSTADEVMKVIKDFKEKVNPSGLRDEQLSKLQAKTDSAVKSLLECGMYKGDTDAIEVCLMRVGLDYEGALSVVKTVQAALERRYEEHLDTNSVAYYLRQLAVALSKAEEPEPDPRAGEDAELDDNRRW